MAKYIFWLIFVLLSVIVIFFGRLIIRKRKKGHLRNLLGMSLFLVKLPKYEVKLKEGEGPKDFKEKIGAIEQFYTSFSGLKSSGWRKFIHGQPRITLEIANTIKQEEVGFYFSVPKTMEAKAKQYIQGIYPAAEIERCHNDYNPFVSQGKSVGGYLMLEKNIFLPINTYTHLSVDPLGQITNTLANILPEEGAAVQIVLRPADKHWQADGRTAVNLLSEGKTLSDIKKETKFGLKFEKEISGLISPSKSPEEQKEENIKPVKIDEITLEQVKNKTSKTLFSVDIRILASSQNKESAERILESLLGAFGQYGSAQGNEFKFIRLKKQALKKMFYNFSLRAFDIKKSIILNTEELASLYHLSLESLKIPKIKKLKTIKAPLPVELPSQGPVILGETSFRDEVKKVYFANDADRRRHFYIIGQTGTGKTSLLKEMIRQDIEAGRGVGVIDPHGDLIESILANTPVERKNDIILFEPFDTAQPVGLNMLEYETEEQKDFAVQEMVAIFQKLFPPEVIGPMFEHYMRNAMLALMADKDNPGTLVEIPRIFTDDKFMDERLAKVKDIIVKQFWEKEWKKTTGQTRSDMLGYVVSKIGRFIENSMMRNIIGQAHSGFNLGKIMDEGKIFLANLSKGQTGEVNSSLLGLILMSKFQMAAMRRGNIPENERRDFYLYADEFQNFTTDSIPTILSEARKYRLNLTLAHQFIAQLEDNIRDAVFGNVGSIMSFRVGVEDAERIEKQFEPEFVRQDLVNLPNFESILKLMINGQVSSAFRMKTIPPKEGDISQISEIKEISKQKYARKKSEAEEEISKRANLGNL
jgi:hypothetical protein